MLLYAILSRKEDAKRPSKFFGPFQSHLASKDIAAELFGQNYLFHKKNIKRSVKNRKKLIVIQRAKNTMYEYQLPITGWNHLVNSATGLSIGGRRIIFDTFTGRKLNYNTVVNVQ
jgi:hypothetical protein